MSEDETAMFLGAVRLACSAYGLSDEFGAAVAGEAYVFLRRAGLAVVAEDRPPAARPAPRLRVVGGSGATDE